MEKSEVIVNKRPVKFIIFMIVVAFVMFVSCNSNKENVMNTSMTTIVVDEKQLDNPDCISTTGTTYLKSFRYVQLESDTNMLIGEIDKVILNGNRIYIVDKRVTKSLFIFDEDGRFINKISRHGQGPEEYIYINDIFYDEFDETINIQSWSGTQGRFKIMSFDKDGNNLLKQIPVDLNFWQADRMKDGRYVFHAKNSTNNPDIVSNIFVYSPTMQQVYDDLPIPYSFRNRGSYAGPSLFKNPNGAMYCTREFDTDVYVVAQDSLIRMYHYDVGKYTYPEEFKTPEKSEEMARSFQMVNYITDIIDFYENSTYVVAFFIYKGSNKIVFYNKKSQDVTVHLMRNNPFIKDGFGSLKNISNGYIIASGDADSFVSVFNDPTIMGEEATTKLKQQFKRPIKEDDNPILYIYEFVE